MLQVLNRQILLDIETQEDFFSPGGSCFGPASAGAARRIAELFRWARREGIPVLSTLLRVRRGRLGPLAQVPHCVDGTEGERKLPESVLPGRIDLGLRNTTDLPADLFLRYQQVIIEKRATDIFRHERIERIITEMPLSTFVLCGAGVARGIVEAAIGLRMRGFGVILAADAVLDLGDPLAGMARRRMEAKGVVFARTIEIISPKPRRPGVPMRPPRWPVAGAPPRRL